MHRYSNELEHVQVVAVIALSEPLGVPAAQLHEMAALAAAGEPGVALENLCVQLYEYEVIVPARLLARIRALADAMQLESRYWERLSSE